MNDVNTDAPYRSFLYRSLGLLLIGVGAFLSGFGPMLWGPIVNHVGDVREGVFIIGVAMAGLAMTSILFGTVFFAVVCAIAGAIFFGPDTPVMLSAIGLPCAMVGIGLRIFNPL